MAVTLSFGYKKPVTGDKGSVFYPALEDNITRVNGHTHDGVDSAQLTAASIIGISDTILAASHTDNGNGNYSQVVNMPVGLEYDDYSMTFRDASTGDQLLLSTEKESTSTYTIRVNDNSFNITVIYT